MLPRLLILSLLIPASVAPVTAQSSPDKSPFSSWSSQNGLTPPPQFHLRVPSQSQNAQVNSFQPPSPQVTFNLSPTTPHTYLGLDPTSLLLRKLATLAQNAAPCYTIRSYRFTRDQAKSDSTTFADYSTCQSSAQFRVKDAIDLHSR